MKVILVDDEPMVVEHVANLIDWEEHGFELAASAHDGKTALSLYEKEQPELMIVDIQMPGMDGLELIRAITARNAAVKFIVMSAYKDFEYAQQAIELGVSGYMVKHTLDDRRLLAELHKVKDAWEADEKTRRYLQQTQLRNMVMLGKTAPEWEGLSGGQFALLLMQVDAPFRGKDGPEPSASDMDKQAIEYPQAVMEASVWSFAGQFAVKEDQTVLLLSTKANSLAAAHEELNRILIRLQMHFRDHLQTTASVFYAVHNGPLGELPQVYDKLAAVARYRLFCGREARVLAQNLPLQTGSYEEDPMEDLIAGLEQGDWPAVERAVKRRFEAVTEPYWNLEGLLELSADLRKVVKAFHKRRGITREHQQQHAPEHQAEIYHVKELRDDFLNRLRTLTDEAGKQGVSARLQAVLQFIHTRYREDINIEYVAQATGISSSYIHLLFKKELGRTFLDYVTEYRLQHAKRILQNEQVKMAEVAEKVGYRSAQYFSQVFKKHTGMLPHEFRGRRSPS